MRPRSASNLGAAALIGALALAGCGAEPAVQDVPESASIGILRSIPDDVHAILGDELRAQGWNPGRNVRILPADPGEIYASNDEARAALRAWQDDGLDVVIAFSTPYAQLVDKETDLPGLFVVNDPVAGDLLTDLHAPDGQLTGVTFRTPADRTLHIASRLLGGVSRVGYLEPTDDPAAAGHKRGVIEAARALDMQYVEASFGSPEEVASAVRELADAEVEIVYLASSNATVQAIERIEEELERHGLAAVANTEFVEFAVVVLAPDSVEIRRQVARQVARLLSGASIAGIPGEDPRKFVVRIDRTQAEGLGLTVDPEVLREADVVR